jgi:hypothetical protein
MVPTRSPLKNKQAHLAFVPLMSYSLRDRITGLQPYSVMYRVSSILLLIDRLRQKIPRPFTIKVIHSQRSLVIGCNLMIYRPLAQTRPRRPCTPYKPTQSPYPHLSPQPLQIILLIRLSRNKMFNLIRSHYLRLIIMLQQHIPLNPLDQPSYPPSQ